MKRCENCGDPIRKRPNYKKARFCSHDCYSESIRGKAKVDKVEGRMATAKGHPLAPASGRIAYARLALYEKIGPGPHPCHWCESEITWMPGVGPKHGAIIADHINFDRTDDSPDNLVASCLNCNAHRTERGDRNRIQEGELTVEVGGSRTRAVLVECATCGKSFAALPALVRKGEGKYCSMECVYNRNRTTQERALRRSIGP